MTIPAELRIDEQRRAGTEQFDSIGTCTHEPWVRVPEARRRQAGSVWVDAHRTTSPSLPSGGFERSGHGWEDGIDGLRESVPPKAVWFETEGATRDPSTVG